MIADFFLHLFRLAAESPCPGASAILPNIYKGMKCEPDANGAPTPVIHSVADFFKIGSNGVEILVAISGGLAVVMILVASIYYIASMGDPARIKRAKEILQNLAIGLVLIIATYGIVQFIAQGF